VTLARITLASGREIDLASLEIFPTYGAMLEGYPCARVNDWTLARLAARSGPEPVHVITPPRRYHGQGRGRLALGPVEELPALYCRAYFLSERIDKNLDDALHWSRLTVVWFQDDLASPVADFVTAAVSDLAWHELAEDFAF
jgi:hypothetical protein